MEDRVEEVRASVRLHRLQPVVRVQLDLDVTPTTGKSAAFDMTDVPDQV